MKNHFKSLLELCRYCSFNFYFILSADLYTKKKVSWNDTSPSVSEIAPVAIPAETRTHSHTHTRSREQVGHLTFPTVDVSVLEWWRLCASLTAERAVNCGKGNRQTKEGSDQIIARRAASDRVKVCLIDGSMLLRTIPLSITSMTGHSPRSLLSADQTDSFN